MSNKERTGVRDLTYSEWHRQDNLKLLLRPLFATDTDANWHAYECAMIDLDAVEWCRKCKRPVGLVEVQRSAKPPKDATVTRTMADMLGIPAWSISYTATSDDPPEIIEFRVRELTSADRAIQRMTPAGWAAHIWNLHERHLKTECRGPDNLPSPY